VWRHGPLSRPQAPCPHPSGRTHPVESECAADKPAASANAQRTPEITLHGLALAGGWPGALLAQQFLRHKSTKQEFRQTFWGTVLLNLAGLVALASPLRQLLIA